MSKVENIQESIVEQLLASFNEELRCTGRANFELLQHCPPDRQKELRSLMNVVVLAYRALQPEREALQDEALQNEDARRSAG
jgi:hypothetical protein